MSAPRAVGGMARAGALAVAWALWLGAAYEWGGPAARGIRELGEDRPGDAAASFEEARRERPRSAAIRYDQGLAFRALGLGDSARAAMGEALALDGATARSAAAFNLGNDALRADRIQDAVRFYRESLRADWSRVDAKRNLEEALRRLRQEQQARQEPRSGGKGMSGPTGPVGSGGRQARPEPRPGEPQQAGEPEQPSSSEAPPGKGANPSREEAELWLKALESERRSQRAMERARRSSEENVRDW